MCIRDRPFTVCGLKKEHTAAVVEMGVSIPGEMGRIAAVVRPTCAVMTNIGVSHIDVYKRQAPGVRPPQWPRR